MKCICDLSSGSGQVNPAVFENDCVTYKKLDTDILCGCFKEGCALDLEDVKSCVHARKKLTDNQPIKLLICAPRDFTLSQEARHYILSEEAIEGITAMAFIVNHFLSEYLVKLILKLKKSTRLKEIKIFSDVESGLKWLNSR